MNQTVKTAELTLVTIKIGDELYGLNVGKVKEVIGLADFVKIPNAHEFMKGVINLRGRVIPLVDMRLKFKIESKEYDKHTVIVIVKIRKRLIGLIVDMVLDVVDIDRSLIQNTPHFSAGISSDCIRGIAQVDEKTLIIMDVDNIFSENELNSIN